MTTPPAGWYPDGDGRQRWWDGQVWTEHTAPAPLADEPSGSTALMPVDPTPQPVTAPQPVQYQPPVQYPQPTQYAQASYGHPQPVTVVHAPIVVRAAKETGIAYVLAIFLGNLGVHHFYLGRVGPGIAMLLLTIFGWATAVFLVGFALLFAVFVWWVVDLFLIPGYVRYANARMALVPPTVLR